MLSCAAFPGVEVNVQSGQLNDTAAQRRKKEETQEPKLQNHIFKVTPTIQKVTDQNLEYVNISEKQQHQSETENTTKM